MVGDATRAALYGISGQLESPAMVPGICPQSDDCEVTLWHQGCVGQLRATVPENTYEAITQYLSSIVNIDCSPYRYTSILFIRKIYITPNCN